jgi:hypothetical protein
MNDEIKSAGHLDNPYSDASVKPQPLQNVHAKAVDLKKVTLKTAKLLFGGRSKFKPFWRTLKRTVTGQNRAGKILTHVLVGAASLALGAQLQPIINLFHPQPQPQTIPDMLHFHFNILSLILIIVSGVLGYAIKHLKTKTIIHDILVDLKAIAGQMSKARAPDSPKGQKVSPAERQATIQVAETKVIELSKWLLRRFFGGDDSNPKKQG